MVESWLERLRRFIGRQDVDATTFCEIARLMANRMAYEDAIRIAQLKLAEFRDSDGQLRSTDVRKLRFDGPS